MVFFERNFVALRFWLLKLGVSVWLALACSQWVGLADHLSPAFTSLLCIRGTFYTGLEVGLSQLAAVLAGTALSLACTAIFGANNFAIAVSVMLAAFVCIRLHWEATTPLVLFTLLFTHLTPLGTLAQTAEIRILGVLLGVGVATAINFLFSTFRYRRMYYFRLRHALESLDAMVTAVRAALSRGDRPELARQARELKSLARVVSMLYEESVDLRRESSMRRPGNLDRDLIPRIELLSGYLENACWHLFGVADSLLDLMDEGTRVPMIVRDQLEEIGNVTRQSVESLSNLLSCQLTPEPSSIPIKLPFFGMPLPEVTLRAELALLAADVAQIRFHAARFAAELGDIESPAPASP